MHIFCVIIRNTTNIKLLDAKTSGLIRKMDDVKSFTLWTNNILSIQIKTFYVNSIITMASGQYDI